MICPVNIQFEEYDDPKLPYWMQPGTSQPKLEHKLSKMFLVLGKRKVIIIEREGIKKKKKKDQRRMGFWELTQDKVKNYLRPL